VKDLSKDTVSIVVGALIMVRTETLKSIEEAKRDGHEGYQATLQQELDANTAALRELNQDVAPWLEYHPQVRDVFARNETNPTKETA
jgi:hypothetical protein